MVVTEACDSRRLSRGDRSRKSLLLLEQVVRFEANKDRPLCLEARNLCQGFGHDPRAALLREASNASLSTMDFLSA